MSLAHARPANVVAAAVTAFVCATAQAQSASFIDSVLAAIGNNVASVVYTTAGAPGLQMTVSETSTATMTGSTLFDYEGLWLGSDGTGGRYTFAFNQPLTAISFSFIALTNFGPGLVETLNGFVSSTTTTASFSSSDSSSTWSAGTLTPLDEDSRGVLTFTAASTPFTSIRFDHNQPTQLQGFVVERVDVQLAPVPEPQAAWLFGLGLLGLLARWRLAGPREESFGGER